MIINGTHFNTYTIRLDVNTVLHIAEKRQDHKLVCQAKFCQRNAELCTFYTANEIFEHYYVTKCELQDSILRVIDFIDGKL